MVSRTRIQAAAPVVTSINLLESSIDRTLIDGAETMATMLRARQDARLAASVGQEALDQVFAVCTHIYHARRAAVQGHAALDDLRKLLKLPEMGDGGKYQMPDPSGFADAAPVGLVV